MRTTLLAIALSVISCKTAVPVNTPVNPAENTLIHIMEADPGIRLYMQHRDSLNIQVIYTKIDRDSKNRPTFTDYTFNLDAGHYFYPASTVKMPIAFLALEKLNALRDKGIDRNTVMITDSAFSGQQVTYTQPSAQGGNAGIAHYIKQVFLVSDNNASNRMYEFLGQEYIYDQLKQKGFSHSQIRHRLAVVLSLEQNRHTNPVSFYDTAGTLLYDQPARYSKAIFPQQDIKAGKGYYSGDKLVNTPFDFSLKNSVSLTDLHNMMRSMMFPLSVAPEQRFNISDDDRSFLLRWMSSYPRESRYPAYDTAEYPDGYTKFLGRNILDKPGLRIFSKAGWAYGYLTDVAYVIDTENGIEFMLSATILCNSDGIFNDDRYDFETTGYPFMKKLGQLVYQHELERKRKHRPDLSSFRFDYTAN